MKKCLATLTVLALFAAASIALAQRPQVDEQGIRQVLDSYSKAFSEARAPAAGPAFAQDALYVSDTGERVAGREAIGKRLREYLAVNKGDQLRMTAEVIRFASPEIAEVEGVAEIRGPGGPPEISPYVALLVKREGRWLIKSLRDLSPTDPEKNMTPADHIQDLSWMVGEWLHSSGSGTVRLGCRLDASRNFLLWDYTVRAAGKEGMTVSQRIGWDPHNRAFRSWVFDSIGGFAEGRWDPEGDGAWQIRQTGVLPDGDTASAVCRLIPIDKDRFRWAMTDRRVHGARLADTQLTFTRAKTGSK